jgi:hypothetical protein
MPNTNIKYSHSENNILRVVKTYFIIKLLNEAEVIIA